MAENFKEYLEEEMNQLRGERVLQALADKDINASIKNGEIHVSSDDVKEASAIVKKLGCKLKVKGGLNE